MTVGVGLRRALGYGDLLLLGLALLYVAASNLPFITLPGMGARAPLGIIVLGLVLAAPVALQAVGMVADLIPYPRCHPGWSDRAWRCRGGLRPCLA